MQPSPALLRSKYNIQFTRYASASAKVAWGDYICLNWIMKMGIDISDPAFGRQFSVEQHVCNILKIRCSTVSE
jgi:hypothetical protein